MFDLSVGAYLIAALSVVLVGIGKAGFGGGVGVIATPLMALAMGEKAAIGVLLPVLCACDVFSVFHYYRHWDRRSVALLLPGAVLGVFLAYLFLQGMDERAIQVFIGVVAVAFVVYDVMRQRLTEGIRAFRPGAKWGWAFGAAAGITSTIAHAAGPVVTMFVLPQRFDRKVFVGTTVIFFTIINAIKLVPYAALGMFDLKLSLALAPFAPLGVGLGIWMIGHINEQWFHRIIYGILFVTGVQLIVGRNVFSVFWG